DLAWGYAEALKGTGIADSRSGLFLAGPRRTGKSTFLREDLLPELGKMGWTTVYVDLWVEKDTSPAILIAREVRKSLSKFSSAIAKLARATGLEKVTVFGALSLSMASLSLPEDVSLADALEALTEASGTPVVVILDEAQHVLNSKEGLDAMFGLKAARDRLNQSAAQQRLFLVFTGSNQDKLAQLLLKRNQPFFGCRISKFPKLGKEFTDAFTDDINSKLAPTNQFNKDDVFETFKLVGNKPELLRNIISELALDGAAPTLAAELKAQATAFRELIWGEMESEFAALSPVQRAVLERMLQVGSKYTPFSDDSLKAYSTLAGQNIDAAAAQGALKGLREKNLVWQAAYGDYALEDESMATWYQHRGKGSATVTV
ncbi:MAG: ATP-binding protein, partial [Rhodoferax sp.]|nr:ATP-binding protein [Rhodoferax sp.]